MMRWISVALSCRTVGRPPYRTRRTASGSCSALPWLALAMAESSVPIPSSRGRRGEMNRATSIVDVAPFALMKAKESDPLNPRHCLSLLIGSFQDAVVLSAHPFHLARKSVETWIGRSETYPLCRNLSAHNVAANQCCTVENVDR